MVCFDLLQTNQPAVAFEGRRGKKTTKKTIPQQEVVNNSDQWKGIDMHTLLIQETRFRQNSSCHTIAIREGNKTSE